MKGKEGSMNPRRWLVMGIVALLAAAGLAQDPAERYVKVVGRMVEAINAGDYPGTQRDFSKIMLDAFPLEKAEPFFKDLVANYGKITRLGPPRLTPPNQAVFPAFFERTVLDIRIILDHEDQIVGLWFNPHMADIPVPESHATVLRLPFAGRWQVVWGGDTRELNQHHDVTNQRYAFDFLGTDEQGKSYKNDGSRNEDYYAFGREILAPADGVVTDVIEGVRDNQPGSMNPYSAVGNAVFVRHRDYEVSVFAHFQQGSIRVRAGDAVKAGQVLGLCGNSGNSSEPHLHYHLQNTSVIQEGTGIKCFFDKVILTRGGKTLAERRCSPIKGDLVEQR